MVLLPTLSGLTSVEINPHNHNQIKQKKKKDDIKPQSSSNNNNEFSNQYGYISPDTFSNESDTKDEGFLKQRAHALKEKLQLNQEDMPIQIHLKTNNKSKPNDNTEGGLRNRKKEKLDLNTDPNTYDYDLDDLIKEETSNAQKQQQKEFYKDQIFGKEKEAMV
ncbi:hypothetical protein KGF54_001601 [Candida jiufengensis]|uniref:uncharacterized protein n=1 Tax=Candida jiufengensis TaxID=497108 RepID=UPI002225558E|nr:uncharacterized protein KGF54_001601 [Candida jiufengensis]KAI5955040.1 hypothetical protein KGF54_001601 [Candida jiufengensis]